MMRLIVIIFIFTCSLQRHSNAASCVPINKEYSCSLNRGSSSTSFEMENKFREQLGEISISNLNGGSNECPQSVKETIINSLHKGLDISRDVRELVDRIKQKNDYRRSAEYLRAIASMLKKDQGAFAALRYINPGSEEAEREVSLLSSCDPRENEWQPNFNYRECIDKKIQDFNNRSDMRETVQKIEERLSRESDAKNIYVNLLAGQIESLTSYLSGNKTAGCLKNQAIGNGVTSATELLFRTVMSPGLAIGVKSIFAIIGSLFRAKKSLSREQTESNISMTENSLCSLRASFKSRCDRIKERRPQSTLLQGQSECLECGERVVHASLQVMGNNLNNLDGVISAVNSYALEDKKALAKFMKENRSNIEETIGILYNGYNDIRRRKATDPDFKRDLECRKQNIENHKIRDLCKMLPFLAYNYNSNSGEHDSLVIESNYSRLRSVRSISRECGEKGFQSYLDLAKERSTESQIDDFDNAFCTMLFPQ